mmetsp:Transcript_4447/g.11632  ORF Transcript_4447/g.11632 Transcript_4447/m.11632 type:complete len:219 (-) Transcript_4447:69-725(-)
MPAPTRARVRGGATAWLPSTVSPTRRHLVLKKTPQARAPGLCERWSRAGLSLVSRRLTCTRQRQWDPRRTFTRFLRKSWYILKSFLQGLVSCMTGLVFFDGSWSAGYPMPRRVRQASALPCQTYSSAVRSCRALHRIKEMAVISTQITLAHEWERPLTSLMDPTVPCERAVTPLPMPSRYLEISRSHLLRDIHRKNIIFLQPRQSAPVDMSRPWEKTG